mmetsp:Transcript_86462/g.244255  ORF Transcript_86462/g.244255 Transcript_86462/m.244255 type:complete len:115 (-) Transcript_86462:121-465(-)
MRASFGGASGARKDPTKRPAEPAVADPAADPVASPERLRSALRRGALVVDVRAADSSELTNKSTAPVFEVVDGSLSAPYDKVNQTVPVGALGLLQQEKSAPLVVHCRSGAVSDN